MKEFKGTKGKWEVDVFTKLGDIYAEPQYLEIGGDNFAKVCKVWKKNAHRNDQNQDYETSLANAKLIAAAPDLLEFAIIFENYLANNIIDTLKAKEGHSKEVADMVGLCGKAIKKALGE